MHSEPLIFAGKSHPEFAHAIAKHLKLTVAESETIRFSNENLMVEIKTSVRARDVFVVQTSCPPVNEKWMELLIFIDALKSASAGRVTAVLPYYPYVRSDKKDRPRISITAKLVAKLLEAAGVDRTIMIDLHSDQIQGFFNIPTDHLRAASVLCKRLKELGLNNEGSVVVAPDAGEAKHVGPFANSLDLPFAIIDKRRVDHSENAIPTNLVGDVTDKIAIVADDEIASGGTMVETVRFLKKHGAREVVAVVTHGVFSGNAPTRLAQAGFSRIITTDTIPCPEDRRFPGLESVSVAPLFAETIRRVHNGESVSCLFK